MRSGKKKHSQIGAINAFGGENCEFFSARRWFENCLKRMAELRKINWIKYRFRHMARKFAALNPVGLLCVKLKVARTNRIKNTVYRFCFNNSNDASIIFMMNANSCYASRWLFTTLSRNFAIFASFAFHSVICWMLHRNNKPIVLNKSGWISIVFCCYMNILKKTINVEEQYTIHSENCKLCFGICSIRCLFVLGFCLRSEIKKRSCSRTSGIYGKMHVYKRL